MGGEGKKADNYYQQQGNPLLDKIYGAQNSWASNPAMLNLLTDYGQGNMSLNDALSQAQGLSSQDNSITDAWQKGLDSEIAKLDSAKQISPQVYDSLKQATINQYTASHPKPSVENANMSGQMYQNFIENLATNPLSGTKLAVDQVMNNPMLAGLFGDKGYQGQLLKEQSDLASRGYSLQPEDYEAYGQASGNVARLFGQEEQDLASALQQRGLAAAPSGAAVVGYSGLMGNKNERLAQAQRQIADNRMSMNLQRLNATRNALSDIIGQGQTALQNQFGRNLAGVQNMQGERGRTLQDYMQMLAGKQGQENTGFQQQEATKGPSFGDIMGKGLGMLGGSALGGLGSTLGSNLAGGINYNIPGMGGGSSGGLPGLGSYWSGGYNGGPFGKG